MIWAAQGKLGNQPAPQIREWRRLGWDATVMKILLTGPDEPIRVQDRQSPGPDWP
jgi:hypothetical protein